MQEYDRQLRYFMQIASSGSLSAAAEQLSIAQPSLSRQLANLEQYLGKPLFDRHGRGVQLTEAGMLLYEQCQASYRMIDERVAQIRDSYGVTQGSLRIATVHTLTYYFMNEIVTAFTHQREQVNLALMARSSPEVVELVEQGKADLGFVYDAVVASDKLHKYDLFTDKMMLIVPKEENTLAAPVDLRDQALKLVCFPPHYALRRMLDSSRLSFQIAAEVETVDAKLRLVASGLGACVLPCNIPPRILRDYDLQGLPIAQPLLERRVVAIHRSDRKLSAVAQLLLEIARKGAHDAALHS